MDAITLADNIADPIQTLGMSYYFDPGTGEVAKTIGLNVVQLYGLGRGGVLGAASEDEVFEAFTFFSRGAIANLWTASSAFADPVVAAAKHLEAAYAYADRTFASVDDATLAAFADVAFAVAANVPSGRYPIFDGYHAFTRPATPRHAAYLGTILMRELRGGVHIDAVREAGITPEQATYLTGEMIFKLHGYQDSDVPEITPEVEQRKAHAEVLTSQGVAQYLDVLSPAQRDALAAGTAALAAALAAAS